MTPVMRLLELRVIAGLGGIGSGVPLLFLHGMSDPMPALAAVSGHSALVVFVAILITWMLVFRWLRERHSSEGWLFSSYGGVLGALPGVIYSVANFFAAQPAPLLVMTAAGLVAGAFAGFGIQRWDDGLPSLDLPRPSRQAGRGTRALAGTMRWKQRSQLYVLQRSGFRWNLENKPTKSSL